MNQKEKLELYNRAKEAYYNGQEIMTDFEFDQLEKELGLENKSNVGTRHNPSYTIQHPYIMGSLSKVQIHRNKEGNIDWEEYFSQLKKYINPDVHCIITPKYDGCSFEIYVKNGEVTVSSRGDGTYGKDLKKHIINKIPYKMLQLYPEYTLRGEVLVDKNIFEEKYVEQFTNPRSFVSGMLNSDYSNDKEYQEKLNDLSIVIYDLRINGSMGWEDYDWTEIQARVDSDTFFDTKTAKEIVSMLPNTYQCRFIKEWQNLRDVYWSFDDYRKHCEYALDGIVIKPRQENRIQNYTETRPKDCVAIKFIPMLQETEVINITWNLGKTHEFIPIIWVRPVEMDGRMVQKCSGHNLGYLREKGITVGAKIIMSLAGDIIPFMYKVTKENPDGEIPMPTTYGYYEDDIHLMALMSMEDRIRMQFLSSVTSLNIPNIGPASARDIFEYLNKSDEMTDEFFGDEKKELPFNILLCSPEEIYFGVGGGKSGQNAQKAFKNVLENLTLVDIIKSCNFKLCGGKVAEQVANYLIYGKADWSHLATEGYLWVYDKDQENWKMCWQMKNLMTIMNHFGKTFEDFKERHEEIRKEASTQIPVILTGEPNNYKSKGEFLSLHPEYRNTGSWKEVQIVFTNSLDSNTGKMKKAREKGIKIELY